MGLLDKSYPDTYKGGQQCREDIDSGRVILYGKEPEGYSEEFLRGFRNPGTNSDGPFGEVEQI